MFMKSEGSGRRLIIILVAVGLFVSLLTAFILIISLGKPPMVAGQPRGVINQEKSAVSFAWPGQGQASIGTLDSGLKATLGDDSPHPIASLAKLITALVVLEVRPLDGSGPMISITNTDVQLYQANLPINGSSLYVETGEQLSQRQMLEALMVLSANNVAETLVRWAFGSFDDYKTAAERWLGENGLHDTTIGNDASGLDPGTTSTTTDLFKLAQLALKNPVLREIMKLESVDLPMVGTVKNTNFLLRDGPGYIGIKTGNSDEAGSCLIFAYEQTIGKSEVIVIGTLTGQSMGSTFDTARGLTQSAISSLAEYKIPAGTVVGQYQIPWGWLLNATTRQDVTGVIWRDEDPNLDIVLDTLTAPFYGHDHVGAASFGNQSTNVMLDGVIPLPDLIWRIKNLPSLRW